MPPTTLRLTWLNSGNTSLSPLMRGERSEMIVLGVILLLIGWLTGLSILYTVGGILLVVGLVLLLVGAAGHPVGGRRWY